MHLNLVLAVFWLLLGLMLIFQPVLMPDSPQWNIQGTNLSIGWVAIVFAIYNLIRWVLVARVSRRHAREAAAAREHVLRRPSHPPRDPDPNFNFDEEQQP